MIIAESPTTSAAPKPDVRITVMNADSDSGDSEDQSPSHKSSVLSRIKKRRTKSSGTTGVTNLLEEGEMTQNSATNKTPCNSSLTSLTEHTKVKLKPKVSNFLPQMRAGQSKSSTDTSQNASLRGSEVIISVDLELENFEPIALVHDSSHNKFDTADSQA